VVDGAEFQGIEGRRNKASQNCIAAHTLVNEKIPGERHGLSFFQELD
jgi:hypothetical protein